jgi:hypothetical protein
LHNAQQRWLLELKWCGMRAAVTFETKEYVQYVGLRPNPAAAAPQRRRIHRSPETEKRRRVGGGNVLQLFNLRFVKQGERGLLTSLTENNRAGRCIKVCSLGFRLDKLGLQ